MYSSLLLNEYRRILLNRRILNLFINIRFIDSLRQPQYLFFLLILIPYLLVCPLIPPWASQGSHSPRLATSLQRQPTRESIGHLVWPWVYNLLASPTATCLSSFTTNRKFASSRENLFLGIIHPSTIHPSILQSKSSISCCLLQWHSQITKERKSKIWYRKGKSIILLGCEPGRGIYLPLGGVISLLKLIVACGDWRANLEFYRSSISLDLYIEPI